MLPTDQAPNAPSIKLGVEKSNPPEATAKAATYYGQLRRKAREVNEISVRKSLFQELLKRRVGTRGIEEKAII